MMKFIILGSKDLVWGQSSLGHTVKMHFGNYVKILSTTGHLADCLKNMHKFISELQVERSKMEKEMLSNSVVPQPAVMRPSPVNSIKWVHFCFEFVTISHIVGWMIFILHYQWRCFKTRSWWLQETSLPTSVFL